MGYADEQQAGTSGECDAFERDAFVCGTLAFDAAAAEHGTPAAELPACPACGERARRASARYCATCGRHLRERDYTPTDALRASYRWPRIAPRVAYSDPAQVAAAWRHRNDQMARGYVFLAYALIPFVGVVFCVCAFACCAAGLRDARLNRRAAEAVEARRGVVFAVLLAGAQTFIWLVAFYLPWRLLS